MKDSYMSEIPFYLHMTSDEMADIDVKKNREGKIEREKSKENLTNREKKLLFTLGGSGRTSRKVPLSPNHRDSRNCPPMHLR